MAMTVSLFDKSILPLCYQKSQILKIRGTFTTAMLKRFCYNRDMNELIKHKLELLPDSPGCYIHKDKNGTIIYVGKAKI